MSNDNPQKGLRIHYTSHGLLHGGLQVKGQIKTVSTKYGGK